MTIPRKRKRYEPGKGPRSGKDTPLTLLQERAVNLYLGECSGNATESCRRAGYALPDEPMKASARASQIFRSPAIRARISQYVQSYTLSAERILTGISERATWNADDFYTLSQDDGGNDVLTFDYGKARERGKLHLIDRISHDSSGRVEVRLPNRDQSLALLARYHGLLVERIQIEHTEASDEAMRDALRNRLAGIGQSTTPQTIDVTPEADSSYPGGGVSR
jgi:phage terminase small subunit